MDLKIDDLLEKQKDGVGLLNLEYVGLSVPRVLALLNKYVPPFAVRADTSRTFPRRK